MRRIDSPKLSDIANNTVKKMGNEEHLTINQEEEKEEEELHEVEEEEYEDNDDELLEDEEEEYEDDYYEYVLQTSGMMAKLPVEIFFEILSRVPIKSLSQCRKVCIAWYNSIQHPLFIKMQFNRAIKSNSHLVILYDSRTKHYYFVDHESLDGLDVTEISQNQIPRMPYLYANLDSCNGLVFRRESPGILMNPITGDFMMLPNSPKYFLHDVVSGFGFDSINEEYKVIRVVQIRRNCENERKEIEEYGVSLDRKCHCCEMEAEIYTFSSARWATISNVPYILEYIRTNAFLNGVFHWIGVEHGKPMASKVIVSFRLSTEEFQEIPLPHGVHVNKDCRLCVLGGCLCLSCDFDDWRAEIWVMKEYGSLGSWSKEYIVKNMKPWFKPYEPLKLMDNGEILLMSDNRIMGYYDPEKETYKLINLYEFLPDRRHIGQSLIHVGSLISPQSISGLVNYERGNLI